MSPGLGQAGRSGVREADLARDQIAAAGAAWSPRVSERATPWDPASPPAQEEATP